MQHERGPRKPKQKYSPLDFSTTMNETETEKEASPSKLHKPHSNSNSFVNSIPNLKPTQNLNDNNKIKAPVFETSSSRISPSEKANPPNWLNSNFYSNVMANMLQTYFNSLASTINCTASAPNGPGSIPAYSLMMPFYTRQALFPNLCSPEIPSANLNTSSFSPKNDQILNLTLPRGLNSNFVEKNTRLEETKNEIHDQHLSTSDKICRIISGNFLWTTQLPAFQLLTPHDQVNFGVFLDIFKKILSSIYSFLWNMEKTSLLISFFNRLSITF